MFSHDDVSGVYSFIKSTPESHLRKMLVAGDLTELHFKLLLKLGKHGSEESFIQSCQNEGFEGLRLNAQEIGIKEKFWPVCWSKFVSMGLLQKAKAA